MIRTFAVVFALALVASAAAETPKEALEKIQGTWKPEKLEFGGEPAPKEVMDKLVLTIKGNQIVGSDDANDPATLELDPSKTPGHVTLTEKNGKKQLGIYKLDGDVLTLCFAEGGVERPAEFKSPKETKIALIVLKRMKK